MSDILDQVGITKDELIDRIVSKALGITADYRQTGEESWDDIPLSEVVDKKITAAIGNLIDGMKPLIESRLETIMEGEIEKVFNHPFQRVDHWGEPKGEPTTIRDLIAKEAAGYWTTKVDNSGRPLDGYSSSKIERAEFFARKVMTEYYEKELVAEVKKMALELKQQIPSTIAAKISETVLGYLK